MAYCDVCGNYDKQHVEDIQENVSTVPDEDAKDQAQPEPHGPFGGIIAE